MSEVAVVTDTTHYLPRELVAAAGLHEVSLYVNWPDGSLRESELDSFDAFYDRLRDAPELPTTSQPSVGDFLAVYEPLVAAGRRVVSVHLSGGLSGTSESARQAAAQLPDGAVLVMDSETACGGLGIVLLAAAAAARGGADAEGVLARARETRAALRVYLTIDTFDYLRRGGRIGRTQALAGSALKIKPIVTVESEMVPVERVRTEGRLFARLVEFQREFVAAGSDAWAVQHIQAPERARRLVAAGRDVLGCEPLFVSEIGPVIGTHTGPGMLGLAGVPSRLLSA